MLRSEDLYDQPEQTYGQVLAFLGLPPIELDAYPRYTRGTSTTQMSDAARQRLTTHFGPLNERLAALLGERVWWDGR